MPGRVEDPWYDADHQVRRLHSSGEIMWKGERVFISEALVGELVASPSSKPVRFCDLDVGIIELVAGSPGLLRFGMGSAKRANRTPWTCRESSRSKMSTIIPVEPVLALAPLPLGPR
jgi:hypothetical protein